MGLTDNGMSPADMAAVMGNGNNGFGWGGDGAWWLLVLFLFAFNGNGFGYGGGNGGTQFVDNTVQRGFDQTAIMNGITGLNGAIAGVNQAISNGFAQAEISNNARQMADMNQSFANQTAILQGFNSMQAQFAQCCCDNRLATCQTQNLIQAENAATRQAILDKMCQQEIEAKNTEIAASLKDALSALDKIEKRMGESMNYSEGYHYGPKRSPVTGRYVSYGNTHNYGNRLTYGSDHYSGHSIKDRMVARLEPMYDEAASEHERQMIDNAINRIQSEL